MRVSILVLLAVLCVFVHLSSAHDLPKSKPKKAAAPEKAHAKPEKKKHFEIRREVKKRPGKQIPCTTVTKKEKDDCDKATPAAYKPLFTIKETENNCEWTCDYELLPTAAPVHHKKLVKKLKEKAPKEKKKECSGEKKIRFSNCLVSIKGLIAWGDKTRNFDQKFEKFVSKKSKKAKKAK